MKSRSVISSEKKAPKLAEKTRIAMRSNGPQKQVVNMPVVSRIFVICDERFKRWLHQDEHKNIDGQL